MCFYANKVQKQIYSNSRSESGKESNIIEKRWKISYLHISTSSPIKKSIQYP